jgi:hypothetical protein
MVLHINGHRTKSVRFAPGDDLCEFQPGPKKLTAEMTIAFWYQRSDFDGFIRVAKAASENAIRKGLSAYINRTYGYSDDKTQKLLNMWARCSDTSRGLERFINPDYGRHRLFVRRKTVRAVLYTQARLCHENEQSYDRASAVISKVATTLSADPIKFAAMLGSADYAAAVIRSRATRKVSSARSRRPPLAQRPQPKLQGNVITVMTSSPKLRRETQNKRHPIESPRCSRRETPRVSR